MHFWFGEFGLTRLVLQRGLGAIYFVAFLNVVCQFRPLLGERGLLPVPAYLKRVTFLESPSIFHLDYSDRLLAVVGWLGVALSMLAVTGVSDNGPLWLSLAVWSLLYLLYLSIVNVGQSFYSFGWESMLLEAGFFAVFLGPRGMVPAAVPVLALRWMLFRVELGAGLIKLRGDSCWRDLTCLYYHHETQPLPNPLSAYFHHLPKVLQRMSVAFSHFVQLLVPFGLWGPKWLAAVAGCLLIVHQLLLIVSGNYAWLNWLALVLGFSTFSDKALKLVLPVAIAPFAPRPLAFDGVLYALAAATLLLSIKPTLNLFSKQQTMNETYNPLHLVGSYGAFGSVTRQRHEVVLEGTLDEQLSETTHWREYELKGKPGDPKRWPSQWAPYHLRLDWLMWFLPLRAVVTQKGVLSRGHPMWFMRLARRLLEADAATLALLRGNPFGDQQPSYVRASFYSYQMASPPERRRTGNYWKRRYVGEYLPALSRRARAESQGD
ncbi:MAG TPA: lipase maturation factor family protein [Polyangiaceae bacterium]|nr:lipase maturation factor family protein [Polyangiaceae bacterium]